MNTNLLDNGQLVRFMGGCATFELEKAFPLHTLKDRVCIGIDSILIQNDKLGISVLWVTLIQPRQDGTFRINPVGLNDAEEDLIDTELFNFSGVTEMSAELTELGMTIEGCTSSTSYTIRLTDPRRLSPDCFEKEMKWIITPSILKKLPNLIL